MRMRKNGDKNKELEPQAFLLPTGVSLYYDEKEEQIPEMQRLGLSGLHKFVERYPQGKVYWAVYQEIAHLIAPDLVPGLLRYIRKRPGSL